MADASQFKPSSRWQFFCKFRKEWINCTAEEDQSLKAAFLVCNEEAPTHQYILNNLKMKVDFSKMLRTNLASERAFELKLVGGQLPFAPPGLAGKKMRGRKKLASVVEKVPEQNTEETPKPPAPEADEVPPAGLQAKTLLSEPEEETTPAERAVKFDFVPNMSGKFEFTLQLEDKDDWGKVFLYKMLEAGIDIRAIDVRYVVATDKRGRSTSRNREEMREMFEVARSYPVKVTYDPPDKLHPNNWWPGEKAEWEFQSLLMNYIKASITGPGAVTMDEIKYRHHRCVFERFQLYVGEEEFWLTDQPFSEDEFYAKYPEMAPMVSLAAKVGPRLRDIFRGKEEILNMLFGG